MTRDRRDYVKHTCRHCGVTDGHDDVCLAGENELLRSALGYALPTIGCGATQDKIAKLLGYPDEGDLEESERRFLALRGG